MLLRSSLRRTALIVGIMAVLIGGSAHAADNAEGSKNFAAPASVPNYFSNESGPLQGPASETRRGPLYPAGTTAVAPQAAARTVAVAAPRVRQHIAMAVPRTRVIRGRVTYGRVTYERRGRMVAERRTVTRGRPVYHAAVYHAPIYHAAAHNHGRVERVVAHAHPRVHHPTHVSSAHHRGRG